MPPKSTATHVPAAVVPLGHPHTTPKSKQSARKSSDADPENHEVPKRKKPKAAEVKRSKKEKKEKKEKKAKKRKAAVEEGGDTNSGKVQSIGHSHPGDEDPHSLARSHVEVNFSDSDEDSPLSTSSSALPTPAAAVPFTPTPTPAHIKIKDEPSTFPSPSPLNDRSQICTQSLTYAIAMTALGLNDGSRATKSLYELYLAAKRVARKKGKSPVEFSKFVGHLSRGKPQAKVRLGETMGRMTAVKPKSQSRFDLAKGTDAMNQAKDAVAGADATKIADCSIWRRGIVLADTTGATGTLSDLLKLIILDFLFPEGSHYPLGEAAIDVVQATTDGPLRSDCLRPYAVPIVATVFSLASPSLADHFGMPEVHKATSSCVDDLYKRLVAGLDRTEAGADVVRVLEEMEASFVEVVEEEVRKRIGLHPAAGQGL